MRSEIGREVQCNHMGASPVCQMEPLMQLSLFTSDTPLSKTFKPGPEGVEKVDGGRLVRGYVERKRFLDIDGFTAFLSTLNGVNALAYGVPDYEHARVLSRKALGSEKGGDLPIITRTKENFDWPTGEGIMMLDHDLRKDGSVTLNPEQLLLRLCQVCPELRDAPLALVHSTSSFIYDDKSLFRGQGGMKVYIHVQDTSDIPRAGLALFKRLWLSGQGYMEIGENGRLHAKTIIDASVWSPERLDFAGGAHCVDPVRQERPEPIIQNGGFESEPFDTRCILDLTEEEEAQYEALVKAAQSLLLERAKARRQEWLESMPEKQREAASWGAEEGILPADMVLTSVDGEEFTVLEALQDKDRYHGVYVQHPFEPNYQDNDKLCQLKLDNDPRPCIHTFAHGGETFWLDTATAAFADIEPTEPALSNIERLNKEFSVATIGSKVMIIHEDTDDVIPLRKADFETLLQNQRVWSEGDKPKSIPLSKIWLESEERRRSRGICFRPEGCDEGWVNLWQGFALEPLWENAAERCRLYREHVEKVICCSDPVHIQYVWSWMAHLVQSPGGMKPGVALVLRGGRGTGKGMFVRPLLRIFGRHGIQLNNREHLTGRFNHHLSDKVLVFLDEAFWAGDKKSEGVLKGLITEPRIPVERKGVDTYEVDSYVRCIMASNEDWVVPAGPDERRFMVMDVGDEHKQDSNGYFKALAQEIDNGGAEALLAWLLQYKVEIDLFKAPESAARLHQKQESLEAVYQWWLDCLHKGAIYDHEWPDFLIPRYAMAAYSEWAKSWPGRPYVGEKILSRKIYGPKGVCPGHRSQRVVETERENGYHIPALESARENFEKFIGGAIEWDDFSEIEY